MSDIITIGSATMDVFVECEDANIVSVRTLNRKAEFMSYPYGSKIEISDFDTQVGGGGVNTATNFANLGYNTAAIFKVGDDIYSKGIFKFIQTGIFIVQLFSLNSRSSKRAPTADKSNRNVPSSFLTHSCSLNILTSFDLTT